MATNPRRAQPQQGPKYPAQIELEAREDMARRERLLRDMKQELENMKSMAERLQQSFADPACTLSPAEQKDALKNCIADVKKRKPILESEIRNLQGKMQRAPEGEKALYKKAAEDWFAKANTVLDTSKKNKLYLGNRQFVTAHAIKDPLKKKRYLDAGVWSWGVNLGWVEGGIAAKAMFRIKFNPGDNFSGFPAGSLEEIEQNPHMSPGEWLGLCAKYPNTLLYHGGENRPTWFAKEIEAALSAGYHFVSGWSKSGDQKLTLETN
jgi:hypothetical protein